ncbi:lung seven transmembrane receptor-domain-containing protein, partial [Catenaria anguillulae PL171]
MHQPFCARHGSPPSPLAMGSDHTRQRQHRRQIQPEQPQRRLHRASATSVLTLAACILALAAMLATSTAASAIPHPQTPAAPWSDADINAEVLDQIIANRICFAMNAQDSIPSGQPAYLEVKYTPPSQGAVALAAYNLLDQDKLGTPMPEPTRFGYQCTQSANLLHQCEQIGQILFRQVKDLGDLGPFHAPTLSEVIDFSRVALPYTVRYNITVTGLYCLVELPLATFAQMDVLALADLKYVNAHGLLPAIDYPKMPFYGFTCLVYLAVLLLWLGKSALHWSDILPVQKYIAGVIAFVTLETAFNYWYYASWNATGDQSWPLLLLSALLNSTRNSASLFILLIVALGYGVVKPSLGDDMRKCQALALVHMFFGAVYTGITLKQSEHKSAAILLVIVPLAVTLTVFYVWTLSALTATTHHLQLRRQFYKLQMYTALWRLLFFAGINLALYFIVNTLWFAQRDNVAFVAAWWSWRWFVVDGWLNALYSVCMLAVCALWRPTSENARYGLEELVSDPLEDEFDLGDGGLGGIGGGGALFDDEPMGPGRYASGSGAASPSGAGGAKPTTRRAGGDALQDDQAVVFALDSDSDADDGRSPERISAGRYQGMGAATLRSRSPSPTRERG